MTEQRLQELDDLRRRERILRRLKDQFQYVALRKNHPEHVKFIEGEHAAQIESVFNAANHISLGAWVRIAAIIESEWSNASKEFEEAR